MDIYVCGCVWVCIICVHVFVGTQGMAGASEQTWPTARPELVPHLHTVVEIMERLC